MLSNGGMTLALLRQGHDIRITEVEKMTYFGEITGPCSLSIQRYSEWQILVCIFQKLTSSTLYKVMVDLSNRLHNGGKCVAMATWCQMLACALDDIKCHISATSEDIWTT